MESAPFVPLGGLSMLLVGLIFLGLYLYSIVWSYNDAESRGKSGCLVALLVALLSWPIGLIVWVVLRPENGYRGRGTY